MHPRLVPALVVAIVVASLTSPPVTAQPAGHLVIIGGGSRPAAMMERIVALAGGEGCRMLVIPTASSEPLETALYQRWQLEEAGCGEVDFVRFDRETADKPEVLGALDGVTGVFFSGGDQRRLHDAMFGTRLLERVRAVHAAGGVVAGTSAGAAVMSGLMITGDERLHPEEPEFDTIRADNVITREGFGFLESAIVDQHFVARSRHNRLISLVLENPELLGIGIDESTAIVVGPDDQFEVIGEATVVVYDAADAWGVEADEDGDLGVHGLTVHVLRAGEVFDLRARGVVAVAP